MPTKKRATKRPISKSTHKTTKTSRSISQLSMETSNSPQQPGLLKKAVISLLLVILVLLLAYHNRSFFFAASINRWPLTKVELHKELEKRYGKAVLEDLVSEQLIRQEAAKKGVKATDAEINLKTDEFKIQLGANVNFDEFLAQRGYSATDFRKQVEVQIILEKLTTGAINISDQELKDFIDQNKANLTATDEAALKAEALQYLTSQKKNEAMQKWFTDLKAKSRVVTYL